VLPPDQRFLLQKLSVVSPAGALLLLHDHAWQDDGFGNQSVVTPLPREKSAAEIYFDKWMGPTGHREPHQTMLRSIFFFVEAAEPVNSVALRVTMQRQFPKPKEYGVTLRVSRTGAEAPTVWL
jgi:hypothetical protein